ncbi:MAG TPA: ATP-binding protein [Thermoleophilia bacterium]|nr:ATP-binding protein [Thermoleophilia bacterium]
MSAGDAGARRRTGRGLGALLRERPIVEKILIANSAIILVGAVFGTYFTRRFADQSSLALTAIFFACGVGITVLANYLVLRAALRPLVELSRAMESLHKGEPQEVRIESSDPNLRRVSRSFNDMCQRLEEESKLYSAKLLSSIEEERRRIGRELHDDTSQTLAAVMINLELVEKSLAEVSPTIRERVANSKDLLRYTLEQIKLLVYDLRPVMLDDFGLVPTLRWYIQSHSEGSGPSIELDVDAVSLRLPGDVETALFRIAQEAIANAVKHSGGTKVVVRLETAPGFVHLAVIDNGEGFEPRESIYRHSQPGLGLLSIRERVELLSGTLNIESHRGRGTRVYVVIPLPAAAARPTPLPGNEDKVSVP